MITERKTFNPNCISFKEKIAEQILKEEIHEADADCPLVNANRLVLSAASLLKLPEENRPETLVVIKEALKSESAQSAQKDLSDAVKAATKDILQKWARDTQGDSYMVGL